MNEVDRKLSLLCRLSSRVCGIPIEHCVETMRPLPVESLPGMPFFVLGASIVRGAPIPVIDVARLLGGEGSAIEAPARFVTIQIGGGQVGSDAGGGGRRAALAVEAVLGVTAIDASTLMELPPLLQNAGADVVDAIGTLDAHLLLVLRSAHLVPEAAWAAIAARETGA